LYNGSYTEYLATVAKEKAELAGKKEADRKEQVAAEQRAADEERKRAAREKEKASGGNGPKTRVKISPKFAKLTLPELEGRVGKLEEQLASLEGSFGNPKVAANPQAMKELQTKYDAGKKELAELMAAWEAKAAG
jgi:hypothetical protein